MRPARFAVYPNTRMSSFSSNCYRGDNATSRSNWPRCSTVDLQGNLSRSLAPRRTRNLSKNDIGHSTLAEHRELVVSP